jgi:hypothetical protein
LLDREGSHLVAQPQLLGHQAEERTASRLLLPRRRPHPHVVHGTHDTGTTFGTCGRLRTPVSAPVSSPVVKAPSDTRVEVTVTRRA